MADFKIVDSMTMVISLLWTISYSVKFATGSDNVLYLEIFKFFQAYFGSSWCCCFGN